MSGELLVFRRVAVKNLSRITVKTASSPGRSMFQFTVKPVSNHGQNKPTTNQFPNGSGALKAVHGSALDVTQTMLQPQGFGGFASGQSQCDAKRISLTDFEMGMDTQ